MANENPQLTGWKRWLFPLTSRKIQLALLGAAVAYFASLGVALPEEKIVTVLGIVTPIVAAILGIAWEDSAKKGNPNG